MNKARRFLDRVNSPGVERIVRYNGPNGKFVDFVDIATRESVAFHLEFPDGTAQTVVRPKPARPLTDRRNRASGK